MLTIMYGVALLFTILILVWFTGKNYQKIDPYYFSTLILIPFVILGYWLQSTVTGWEASMIAFCIIYLDSTLILMIFIFAILRTLHIQIRPWIKFLSYGLAITHLFVVWLNVHTNLYFKEITVLQSSIGSITRTVDGPLKNFHTIYLLLAFLVIIGIIVTACIKKGTYSRRTLVLYTVGLILAFTIYFFETLSESGFSYLPFLYAVSDFVLALNYDKTVTHDITAIIADQEGEHSRRGYVALDTKKRFLSCNTNSIDYFPDLATQRTDAPLSDGSDSARLFYSLIYAYETNGASNEKFRRGDMTCVAEIRPFSVRINGPVKGYVFDIRDATEEQRVLDVMASYNESLNEQVRVKTENILEIQSKVVTGMANMIENRDNNTGGHVKRTSDIIKIVLEEIGRREALSIDETFRQDIVRAAPMHDLGKIVVENSILNKPGKLTDEEYEIMKTHSTKSGEMVKILLDGVEE
ncbi:MAG: HD domain-containing protein, partial [Lachnospiraceae bacterium]|nr:HD domain-containing protein [Lachnospiraceae bacterium]